PWSFPRSSRFLFTPLRSPSRLKFRSRRSQSRTQPAVVAMWIDRREEVPGCTTCASLFATRLDANGRGLDPLNIRVKGRVGSAKIASNGNGYLIVYSDADGLWSQRIDDDAKLIGERKSIWSGFFGVTAVTSNGHTF